MNRTHVIGARLAFLRFDFNQVEFIAMNANYLFAATGNTSPDTGKYTVTSNPRNVGITMRLDF